MVQLASEVGRRGAVHGLLDLLRPAPGRLAFALRIALICVLTTLVVEVYQTPEAALSAYLVFFLAKPDRMGSILQSIVLMVMTTVLIGIVFLLAGGLLDAPLLRVSCMAVLSFCLLFLASASKLKPVGATMALVLVYALDVLGKAQIGELATRGLLYAWLMVAIPAAVTIVVSLLLGAAPHRMAADAMARRLDAAASALRGDANAMAVLATCLAEGTSSIRGWIKLAGLEKMHAPELLAEWSRIADTVSALLLRVQQGCRRGEGSSRECADYLQLSAQALRSGQPLPLRDPLAWQSQQDAGIAPIVDYWVDPDAPLADGGHLVAPAAHGFFVPDAWTNPVHVQYALKTTAAAMCCYFLYTILVWPGIHTCLITCFIVAQATAAETIEKLQLRIAGCLVGALAGIAVVLLVLPDLESIFGLLALVGTGAGLAAWVAGGSPRIAYAGLQIAFAFFMCVIQGDTPGFGLVAIRDRVVGIMLGNLVAHLIFTQIWPVSVAARLDSRLRNLVDTLRQGFAERHRLAGVQRLDLIIAMLIEAERDLERVLAEPVHLRPPQAWIDRSHSMLLSLRELSGLLLALPARAQQDAKMQEALDRLVFHMPAGTSTAGQTMPATPQASTGDALEDQIHASLRHLEQWMTLHFTRKQETDHRAHR
ncbi:FUSC family protein [Burkholderiaceae bacterium DAT-1]|nr:FUSC family protein [Burkholderiaceae bacterium DAT-1]